MILREQHTFMHDRDWVTRRACSLSAAQASFEDEIGKSFCNYFLPRFEVGIGWEVGSSASSRSQAVRQQRHEVLATLLASWDWLISYVLNSELSFVSSVPTVCCSQRFDYLAYEVFRCQLLICEAEASFEYLALLWTSLLRTHSLRIGQTSETIPIALSYCLAFNAIKKMVEYAKAIALRQREGTY